MSGHPLLAVDLPALDVNTLAQYLLLLAIICMLWVIYRQGRPRVELHTELRPTVWGKNLSDLHFAIANLSSFGVWVETVEVAAEKLSDRGEVVEVEARVVVPANESKTIQCIEELRESFASIGCKDLPTTGRVRVRARYRVRNSWRRTDWQHYKLTVDLHGVPQFKLQQRR